LDGVLEVHDALIETLLGEFLNVPPVLLVELVSFRKENVVLGQARLP
jgi:hypothetical protein